MKHIIITILIFLLTIAGASAATEYDSSQGVFAPTDIDFQDQKESWLPDWLTFGAFTTIDGYTCSINPDVAKDNFQFSRGDEFCYRNNHDFPVAWLLTWKGDETTNYQWQHEAEKDSMPNTLICVDIYHNGEFLLREYWCDKRQERECTDSDGGKDYENKGNVKFTADGDTTNREDKCSSTKVLEEIYCDSDKSIRSVSKTCSDICYDGECIEEDDEPEDNNDDTTTSSNNDDDDDKEPKEFTLSDIHPAVWIGLIALIIIGIGATLAIIGIASKK